MAGREAMRGPGRAPVAPPASCATERPVARRAGGGFVASVCVIGSSNLDFTVSVPRLPGVGETVSGGTLVTSPGGKGANQAVAARRLGVDVAFVTLLGADPMGDRLASALAEAARLGNRLAGRRGPPSARTDRPDGRSAHRCRAHLGRPGGAQPDRGRAWRKPPAHAGSGPEPRRSPPPAQW